LGHPVYTIENTDCVISEFVLIFEHLCELYIK